jgi:hypothetical protein
MIEEVKKADSPIKQLLRVNQEKDLLAFETERTRLDTVDI